MTIDVLGTEYKITIKDYDDDPYFAKNESDGYCDEISHEIVVCNYRTCPGFENKSDDYINKLRKWTLRHEIVHAFLNESGLRENAFSCTTSWSRNEEMVDWWAIQGLKVYKAWEKANAI